MQNSLVIASIASQKKRMDTLPQTLSSIYPQVDLLYVYLNDYSAIPDFLHKPKIHVLLGSEYGDHGDISKFYPIQDSDGYIFTLDDDLIYPTNYIATMRDKIDFYQRKTLLCVHGSTLPRRPLHSYYRDLTVCYFANALEKDTIIDIPGTGTIAYHSSLLQPQLNVFKEKNMSDIWLYIFCATHHIPIISVQRPEKWLIQIQSCTADSIYKKRQHNDALETAILNRFRKNIFNY